MSSKMMVFSGNANPALARRVADRLYLALGNAAVSKFSDGEITVELNENVRGKDVFVLQSTCQPTNDNIVELLLMIDALRRASAARITAVVPYFGYARQDRRVRSARVPISAKVVADTMVSVGVDRVLTVDLHAEQIQGFFTVPVDNVYASSILNADIVRCQYENLIVVSPDIGGVVRARGVYLESDEIRSHIESGKQVVRLALSWQDQVDFVLDKDLSIRRIRFSEELKEINDELHEDKLAQRDADCLLMGETLETLQKAITAQFGGLTND